MFKISLIKHVSKLSKIIGKLLIVLIVLSISNIDRLFAVLYAFSCIISHLFKFLSFIYIILKHIGFEFVFSIDSLLLLTMHFNNETMLIAKFFDP